MSSPHDTVCSVYSFGPLVAFYEDDMSLFHQRYAQYSFLGGGHFKDSWRHMTSRCSAGSKRIIFHQANFINFTNKSNFYAATRGYCTKGLFPGNVGDGAFYCMLKDLTGNKTAREISFPLYIYVH